MGSVFHPWPGTAPSPQDTPRDPSPVQGKPFPLRNSLPNCIREQGGTLALNCGRVGPPGSPCETHLWPGKRRGELSVGFFFLRKTWQRHPRRGFKDIFLPVMHRLGQSGVPQHATTCPIVVLAQLPTWREGTSASPSQARIGPMSLAFCKSSPFFNLGKGKKKKNSINNSRLFKLQEVLICASNKWLARCQGFSFGLFLTYFYYFCINLGKKIV